VPRHREIGVGVARAICRQLGIAPIDRAALAKTRPARSMIDALDTRMTVSLEADSCRRSTTPTTQVHVA